MKSKLLLIFAIILASCAPTAIPIPAPTDPPAAADLATQEPVITEAPVPTEAPTEPPLACVTLLTPENGADLPPTGKVTFSWTPMNEADSYNLNIFLPSGETVTFETDQTFRDRYMEAFVAGGEYQWQVTAHGADGSEICISEAFAFEKPEHQKPAGNGDGKGGGSDSAGSSEGDGGGDSGPPSTGPE